MNHFLIRTGADMLNLGCGNKPIDGAVNHDRIQHRKFVDIAWDLNEMPWPWEDESFDVIVAHAVFEHLIPDLVQTLNECWRILRPGGKVRLKLPLWNSDISRRDPTHRWFFSTGSLDQFDPDTKRGREYTFYTTRKWKVIKPLKVNNARSSFYAVMEKRV